MAFNRLAEERTDRYAERPLRRAFLVSKLVKEGLNRGDRGPADTVK